MCQCRCQQPSPAIKQRPVRSVRSVFQGIWYALRSGTRWVRYALRSVRTGTRWYAYATSMTIDTTTSTRLTTNKLLSLSIHVSYSCDLSSRALPQQQCQSLKTRRVTIILIYKLASSTVRPYKFDLWLLNLESRKVLRGGSKDKDAKEEELCAAAGAWHGWKLYARNG